ncbi:MAG: hypothetical protein NFCOHLIN_02538 [Gammaproteobacteria bacterium]|nr:hypothetical protein [Gammaproteobacteria bacterium]
MSETTPFPERVDRLIDAWFRRVQRHAIPVLVLAAAAAIGCAVYTVRNVRINTDTADMLSADLPWRQTQIQYQREFPQYSDNIIVVVDGATVDETRDGATRLAQALAAREDLFAGVYYPQGSDFFRRNGLLYLTEAELQDLSDNLARVQPFLARLGADPSLRGLAALLTEALTEPDAPDMDLDFALRRIAATLQALAQGRHARLSWEELINGKEATPEDRRAILVTRPRLDHRSMLPGGPAMRAIRGTATSLGLTPAQGIRVRLTGGAALAYDELNTVSLGAQLASIGSLLMVALVMIVGLRSGWLVFATLAALVLGLLFTAFFATVAIGELNLISVAFAVLYIGLGADYAIYLCLRYKELSAVNPDHRDALARAARHVGGSLGLCTLTTSIGFFAFIPTSYRGVAELGIISGAGMFISLFVTLVILPALLSLRRPSQRRIPGLRAPAVLQKLMAAPLHHSGLVVTAAAVLAVAAVLLVRHARFDYNPLDLQDPNAESVVTYKSLLASNGKSPWSIVALARDANEARAIKARLQDLGSVDSVRIIEDYVPGHQDAKLAMVSDLALSLGPDLDDTAVSAQPAPTAEATLKALHALRAALGATGSGTHQELGAQLDAFIGDLERSDAAGRTRSIGRAQQALLGSLPGRLAALSASLHPRPVTLASLPEDLRARWVSADGRHRVEIVPRENLEDAGAMRGFVEEVRREVPHATGSPIVYLEASDAVIKAFIQAFTYALIAITVLLWVSMKRRVDVILVLAPLLLAALYTGAATVLIGMPFNFANIIALPLLLGMGVDNGIHMVHRFRTAPPEDGLMLNTSTATAIGLSAMTNASGFGNLAISPHAGTASMGVILTIGILVTLACTMLVLPSLMGLLYRSARA